MRKERPFNTNQSEYLPPSIKSIIALVHFTVSFGGIAGLFLGVSVLSGVELIYYLVVGVFYETKRVATKSAKLRFTGFTGTGSAGECNGQSSSAIMTQDQSSGRNGEGTKRQCCGITGNVKRNRQIFNTGAVKCTVRGRQWTDNNSETTIAGQMGSFQGFKAEEWGYHKWSQKNRF